jgi:hypothetical protein
VWARQPLFDPSAGWNHSVACSLRCIYMGSIVSKGGNTSVMECFKRPNAHWENTLAGVLMSLTQQPYEMLIRRWNWKSSLFSSICRGGVFFFANLSAGVDAATGAMGAEFVDRAVTAGFYGALTQAFRKAEPRRAAMLIVAVGVPLLSHSIEFGIHWLRQTPNLRTSIASSVVFTIVSTLFNIFAMRRGLLVVGDGGKSVAHDIRALPRTVFFFIKSGFGLFPWIPEQGA